MIDSTTFASGLADVGFFGLPIVPLAVIAALLIAAVGAVDVLNRRRLRAPGRSTASRRAVRVAWAVWFTALIVLVLASTSFELIKPGSIAGPGLGVAEVRSDGLTREGSSTTWTESRDSPHYVVRVSPGEPFTVLASLRNTGPLPIRLLGWRKPELSFGSGSRARLDDYVVGLAFPRDPTAPSAAPEGVVPFHPVDIAPGAELAVVIVGLGGECADPDAAVPAQDPNHQIFRAFPFVFEVLGWHRVGELWPPFELSVASRPGCETIE